MNNYTFFWHDYETFGTQCRRDRPAQFAGIRTDNQLNEIGKAVTYYCQPQLDYLPEPEACLLTGITPELCYQKGLPEYRFAQAIFQHLSAPETIGVGYNSIRFDDEVTRFMFWRNLIDPYAREWQNRCGRWDLLDVARTTWALRPEGINWPEDENGCPCFKLEHLAAANGLIHEQAHDALSDVKATIALARLLRQRQPKLFDFCLQLSKKQQVLDEIGTSPKPFLHISGMFGVENGCMAIVWPLGWHPINRNELIVWNLAHDPEELFSLDAETIYTRLFTTVSNLPDNTSRLPIKTIHINRSPIVIGNLKVLRPDNIEYWQLNLKQCHRYAAKLEARPIDKRIWQKVFKREHEMVDVDESLYNGFLSNSDRQQLEYLCHHPDQLINHRSFDNYRLEELLFRYRARNFPDTLNENEKYNWYEFCQHRLTEGQTGYLTLHDFLEKIQICALQATPQQQTILHKLHHYAEKIHQQILEGLTKPYHDNAFQNQNE